MATIYVSSTYTDLVEHREAVYRALRKMRHDVLAMEDYAASDSRPLDKCLEDVARSEIYIGVIAWRYGFVPPGQTKAITHLEYEEATRTNRERLIFLVAENALWPANMIDEDRVQIRNLRSSLRLNHIVADFDTADDLAAKVSVAVANVIEKPRDETEELVKNTPFLCRSLARFATSYEASVRFYLKTGAFVLGLGVLLLLTGTMLHNVLLQLGAVLVVALALVPFMTLISTRRKRDVIDLYVNGLCVSDPDPTTARLVRSFLERQLAA